MLKVTFNLQKNDSEGSDHFSGKLKLLDFFDVEVWFIHEPKEVKPENGDPYSILWSLIVHIGKWYKPYQVKVYKNKSQQTGGVYYSSSKFGTNNEMKIFISKEASTSSRFASMVSEVKQESDVWFTGTFTVEDSFVEELKKIKDSYSETESIEAF